jgi:D-serine deaminase-like pyridoxal phosphate-dependent protein
MKKHQLDTPALVLDIDILDENLRKMRDLAAAAGKKLRPHTKTHKCTRLAARQLEMGNCAGVCAAKLSEAEGLVKAGIGPVLITSPVSTPQKIRRLRELAGQAPGLMVVVDDLDNARMLDGAMESVGRLDVLIDIDPEMGRTGIAYDQAAAFAGALKNIPNLRLCGIQCYAGHLQHIADYGERRHLTLERMRRAAVLKKELGVEILTGTGTGTADIDIEIPELTDIQVGSYCVMDSEYTFIGSRDGEENHFFRPALTLLCSVVSRNQRGFVTVDAGLKSLYFTPHAPPRVIMDGVMRADYNYDWFGDEHGKLCFPGEKPALGTVFELSLPHCDPSINMHDRIYVVRADEVIDTWPIDLRGMAQ